MTDHPSTTKPTPPEPKGKPFYTRPKFITSMVLTVVFLILIFQNWDGVVLRIFFWKQENVPAALPYLGFTLIGFTVGWLLKRSHAAAKARK